MERERCSKRNGEPPFLRTLNSTSVKVECCLGIGCFDCEGAGSRPSARRISTSVSFVSVKRDPCSDYGNFIVAGSLAYSDRPKVTTGHFRPIWLGKSLCPKQLQQWSMRALFLCVAT